MGVGTIFLELKQPDRESDSHLPLQHCKLMRGNIPLHVFVSWEWSTGTDSPLHHNFLSTHVLISRIWILKSRICCCVVWILFCLSVRLPFRPYAWKNSATTERIFMKFDIWLFFENLSRISSFIKIWQEERIFYTKTCVHLWYLVQFFLE